MRPPNNSMSDLTSNHLESTAKQKIKKDQALQTGLGKDSLGISRTEHANNAYFATNIKSQRSKSSQYEDVEIFQSNDDYLKPNDALELFAEKVTVAGLKEAYEAKILAVRIMFRLALIFCSIMIVSKTSSIALNYKNQKVVFTDLELIDYRAPFPNVSICMPYFINETMISRWKSSDRLRNKMKKSNLTTNSIINMIASVLFWGFNILNPAHVAKTVATKEAFREAAKDAEENGKTIWEFLWPSCSSTLSNCAFDGQPFDCCRAATIMPMMTTPCIQIRGDFVANISKNRNRDPLRQVDVGLTFDVNTAWSAGNTALINDDGYHIFIDELPDIFRVPVHVPAQMDILLNLAQPKLVQQKTNCTPNDKVPKLKYFDDYDSQGIQCQLDSHIDMGSNLLGCKFPLLSYSPVNESCLFEAWIIIALLLEGGAEAFDSVLPTESSKQGNPTRVESGETMNKREIQAYDNLKQTMSKNSPCKPLCSRWTYPVFSASYGSIQYRDKNLENNRLANRSWSRIRIILPQSSSSRKEEPRSSSYLAFCDIKGMMGIYAGFSVITYVQVLAYGFCIGRSLFRSGCKMQKSRKEIRIPTVAIPNIETPFRSGLHDEKARETKLKHLATDMSIEASFCDATDQRHSNDGIDVEFCLPGSITN